MYTENDIVKSGDTAAAASWLKDMIPLKDKAFFHILIADKNGNYISEPQTDFIFAIIGEESGFVGWVCIISRIE